jgi:hypothetical protein
MSRVVHILGTGLSIKNLSKEEINYINSQPNTIGLNAFYKYQELVGLKLKYLIVGDTHPHVIKSCIIPSIKKAKKNNDELTLFLRKNFTSSYKLDGNDPITPWLNKLKIWKRIGQFPPANLKGIKMFGFDIISGETHPEMNFYWGNKLSEPLYHYRGSLTTAINLCDIYFQPQKIKLLGIDLNTPLHFYDKNENDLVARTEYHAKAYEMGMHATAVENNIAPPIQEKLKVIVDYLNKKGVDIVCCNPKSLLVEEGICEYAPPITNL